MSNRVNISRLEIKNLDDGEVTQAVRVSDDYADYLNDLLPKGIVPEDNMELFKMLCILDKESEILGGLLESAQEHGAYIGGDWIDTETLQPIYGDS